MFTTVYIGNSSTKQIGGHMVTPEAMNENISLERTHEEMVKQETDPLCRNY